MKLQPWRPPKSSPNPENPVGATLDILSNHINQIEKNWRDKNGSKTMYKMQ